MSLQSFGFFGFLLVVAAVYLHLPQRWQSAFLLAASWVFYALAMPSMLGVTIAIAVFTYLCGRGMATACQPPWLANAPLYLKKARIASNPITPPRRNAVLWALLRAAMPRPHR